MYDELRITIYENELRIKFNVLRITKRNYDIKNVGFFKHFR